MTNAFPKSHRLHGPKAFEAVYDAKTREARGPLLVYAKPNGLSNPRLGLSVSRRVGNAVVRGRAKRLLRDAFRFLQHDFPTGYDLVIVVRPHEPLILADYQKVLMALVIKLHQTWDARRKRAEAKTAATNAAPQTPDAVGRVEANSEQTVTRPTDHAYDGPPSVLPQ